MNRDAARAAMAADPVCVTGHARLMPNLSPNTPARPPNVFRTALSFPLCRRRSQRDCLQDCHHRGGSVGFTKKLISDLLKVPEFEDVEFALTDINAHNLDMIAQIIRRIVAVNGLKTTVTATTDRRRALEGPAMSCVASGSAGSRPLPMISVFR